MKYRKKPIIVDAFKWTGDPDEQLPEWITEAIKKNEVFFKDRGTLKVKMVVDQGAQTAELGYYVVMDKYGAMSVYSPEGFEATFEHIESPEADRDK